MASAWDCGSTPPPPPTSTINEFPGSCPQNVCLKCEIVVFKPDRTFENGLKCIHVHHPIHSSHESGKAQHVAWSPVQGPQVFLDTVCFVKAALFVRISQLRVEKSLRQITGCLEPSSRLYIATGFNTVREWDIIQGVLMCFDSRQNTNDIWSDRGVDVLLAICTSLSLIHLHRC